jgi:ABC-type branched-subunit amino acid transport system permease subunit
VRVSENYVVTLNQPEAAQAVRVRWRQRLIGFQAAYYVATGVWPLVHLSSFEAVTGPKTDDWLVHMVGLLAAVIGAALGLAVARDRQGTPEVAVLAAGAALAFAAIDFWYVLNGTISPIYLADALVELVLLVGLARTHRTILVSR